MSKSPHEECQTGIAIEREGEYPPTLVSRPYQSLPTSPFVLLVLQ